MSSASAIADAVVHIPSTSEKTIAVLQDLYRDKVIGVVHLIFDKLRIDPVGVVQARILAPEYDEYVSRTHCECESFRI